MHDPESMARNRMDASATVTVYDTIENLCGEVPTVTLREVDGGDGRRDGVPEQVYLSGSRRACDTR